MENTHTHNTRTLPHIAELSKNARATWFALIGLCLFVGVTLLGHEDADFFAHGAETKLPLVNVEIPVGSFFVFAPVLVAALYIYLHLYLMNLWDALADAPSEMEGASLSDLVFPWLISHAAPWYRNRARQDRTTTPRALGWVVVAVSLVLGWLFGLAVLGGLWFRSLPAHEEWLTLWIALCLWAATAVGYTGFGAARARMQGRPRAEVSRSDGVRRGWSIAFALMLAFLSWETTEGGLLTDTKTGQPILLYPADLSEADLTRKPSGTVLFKFWVKQYEPTYRDRESIDDDTDLTGNRDFIAEATARYNAPLDAPDLAGRDLRNAKIFRAFLPDADLRGAEMQGAGLSYAQMQGANLSRAKMQGAFLGWAEMQGAFLGRAEMQGADLRYAQMQGANLRYAQMQGANLSSAEMQGAVLRGAEMQGADLSWAEMQATDLSFAEMQDADCSRATLRGAVLQSANLTCKNLTQAQLEQAVGNSETVLPEGLTVASCLEALPEDAEAALAHHSEQGDGLRGSRAEIRDALLCDRDADGNLTEQPRRVGRSAAPEQ